MGPRHPVPSSDFITHTLVSTMFQKFSSSLSFLKKIQFQIVTILIVRKSFFIFFPLQHEVLKFANLIYSVLRGAEGHLINCLLG